ncbi:TetR family transcriptional regulator [Streptomyces hygroscopicus]|uniref:TetR/AcrR family transcriptional regulator n=1 Tax=Streptomyces hygroscopicus TaxID=1912 RepID=UPI0022404C60|nr:TetR/AcrR family transcriptional regulator [Streptomyces hygroscopicus]MCW7946391.1 TetR family transcriptional regulator [Streptomyces hygroscopicus]
MHTRRRYHHGDLRAALLARAQETLREKGPAALSLRELARDLGVSHAAPSRHFKDKQALLDALALTGFDRLAEIITASQEGVGESFAERFAAVARAYVGFATANAELLDVMYSIKHNPEASEDLVAASQRWTGRTTELIAEGQRRGEVREGPVERVGIPAFATLHGYADLMASGALPPEANDRGLDELVAYIVRGCAPEKTG